MCGGAISHPRTQRSHRVNGGLFINFTLVRIPSRIERYYHRDFALAAAAHVAPPAQRLITLPDG
jgi:hypothetical protein